MKGKILKEPAKFFCGLTARESFVHASLLANKANAVIFGITLTDTLNCFQAVVPGIISIQLAYYAW